MILVTAVAALLAGGSAAAAQPGEPRAHEPDAEAGRARVAGATIAPQGEWRAGLSLSYFASRSFPLPGASHAQSTGRFALAGAVREDVEVFGALGFLANTNERMQPRLVQAVGDVALGAKWARPLANGWSAGATGALQLPAGVGSVSLAPAAVGASAAGLAGVEGGDAWRWALRGQLGLVLDRTKALLPEKPKPTLVQEFSLGAARYSRAQAGLSGALARGRWAGFLELACDAPIGIGGAALAESTTGGPAGYAEVVGWRVTPGVRATPIRGLALEAALELGAGRGVVRGFASAPPWALRIGATFAFDPVRAASAPEPPPAPPLPAPPEPALVVVPADPPPPSTGWIEGRVTDELGEPVEGAIVAFAGAQGPPLATDAQGRFRSYALAPGRVGLIARRQGYVNATASVDVAAGQAVGATLLLAEREPPPPAATLALRVCDERGAPLAGELRVRGAERHDLVAGPDGLARIERLADGRYELTALAPGRLARRRVVDLAFGLTPIELCLAPAPAASPIEVQSDRVVTRALKFTKTGALADESSPVVDALADVLLRAEPAAIRVEAHAGGMGRAAELVRVTQARADALASALAARGVTASLITAAGLGAARPLETKGKRATERNTRVELVIGK